MEIWTGTITKEWQNSLKTGCGISRVAYWVALHTALLFWISSLTWAAIHLCPVTDRGEQKSFELPERFHFLSGLLFSLSNPRAVLPFSCISSHTPGHSITVLSRKLPEPWKNTAQLSWNLKATTAAFAKEALSDMRTFCRCPCSAAGSRAGCHCSCIWHWVHVWFLESNTVLLFLGRENCSQLACVLCYIKKLQNRVCGFTAVSSHLVQFQYKWMLWEVCWHEVRQRIRSSTSHQLFLWICSVMPENYLRVERQPKTCPCKEIVKLCDQEPLIALWKCSSPTPRFCWSVYRICLSHIHIYTPKTLRLQAVPFTGTCTLRSFLIFLFKSIICKYGSGSSKICLDMEVKVHAAH